MRIDPRVKIIFGTILIILAATTHNFDESLLFLVTSFALALGHFIKWKNYLRRFFLINGMAFFLSLFLIFGAPLLELGIFEISIEGVHKSGIIIAKLNSIILILFCTYLSIDLTLFGKSLQTMGLNRKLLFLLFFCSRYLTLLQKEFITIFEAMKARGFRLKNSLHTYRGLGNLLGSLLIRSLDRAERIHQAMEARGFQGDFHSAVKIKLTRYDLLYSLLMTTVIAILCWRLYAN